MGNLVNKMLETCEKIGGKKSQSTHPALAASSSSHVAHPTRIAIKGHTYTNLRLIGEGGFAFVYSADAPQALGGEKVALKRFCVSAGSGQTIMLGGDSDGVIEDQYSSEAIASALREVQLHQALSRHPRTSRHVPQYHDHEVVHTREGRTLPGPELWEVMELCSGGSLRASLDAHIRNRTQFLSKDVLRVLDCIVSCLGVMHGGADIDVGERLSGGGPFPITHHDIKIENVLIGSDGTFKMCDFGSATTFVYNPTNTRQIAKAEVDLESRTTMLYRSPESLDLWMKEKITTKVDMWALGVLVFTLMYKAMPFEENPRQIMACKFTVDPRISSATTTPPPEDTLRQQLEKLTFEMLLQVDLKARASAFDVSAFLKTLYAEHEELGPEPASARNENTLF